VNSRDPIAGIERAADWFYGGVLITLPWIGFGTVRLLTGVDSGAGFQPSYLLLCGALLLQLTARVGRRLPLLTPRWLQPELRWYVAVAAAVVVVVALSAIGIVKRPGLAPAPVAWTRYFKQAVQLGVMACFVFYPALWTRTPARWLWTARLLSVGLLLQLIYSVFQAVHFHVPLALFGWFEELFTSNPAILAGSDELYLGGAFRQIPRLRGTACEPLYLGNYLLLTLPLLWLLRPSRVRLVLMVAGVTLLLLTWSRGAYLALAAAALVALLLWRRSGLPGRPWRLTLWVMLVAAVATLLIMVAWGPQAVVLPGQRLLQSFQTGDWSNLTRFYSMQAAWRGFLASPVYGLGWGQFPFHFAILVDPLGLQSQFTLPVVNNFPLQILCETGIAGAVVLVASALTLMFAVWRVTGRRDSTEPNEYVRRHLVVVLCSAAVVGVWSQLMTFSQYNLPHIWVAVGLLLASLGVPEPVSAADRVNRETDLG